MMFREPDDIKYHLVSFADGAFVKRANDFEVEADNTGLFDSIKVFNFAGLERDYRINHERFIRNNPRGFGYWIWKPQSILQTLSAASVGDIIVYMDVGFELNATAIYRMKEYFNLMMASKYKMLSFSNTHTEYRWTKMDLASRLGLTTSSPHLLTTQLAAGFIIFQYTQENAQLIKQWRDLAIEKNYHYSSDATSLEANHPEFIEHRHDASIFSLLRKQRGTEITHYEVQAYNHFEVIKTNLPAWASRKGREKIKVIN